MRVSLLALLGLFIVGSAAAIQTDDEAKAIVAKAVQAHGGDAKRARPAYTLKLQGSVFADGRAAAHSGSIAAEGPDRARITNRFAGEEDIQVVNGDQGWVRTKGQTRALGKEELADFKEDLYTDWVTTLLPLTEQEFVLARLAGAKVGNRPAVGVRVARKGHRDVELYFDEQSGLLVKKRITRAGPDGKAVVYETFSSAVKDFDGIKQATTFVTYRDGVKFIEAEVVEAKFSKSLPAGTFAKP
ncbi:hypothetical protein AYO44_09235 [Planctomycetaceae bacterium SCGC AG-212-F19]|nr:hypothetical protein AYO44_09235 [Planctomycetaceae bacterium SCGC AG-212-F19]